MKTWKKISYRIIAVLLVLGLGCVIAFLQPWQIQRNAVDLDVNLARWHSTFIFYLGEEETAPYMITQLGQVVEYPCGSFDLDFNAIWQSFLAYGRLLITKGSLSSWGLGILDGLMGLTRFLMIAVMVVMMLFVIVQLYYDESGKGFSEKSRPLKWALRIKEGPLRAFLAFVKEFLAWFYKSAYFVAFVTVGAFVIDAHLLAFDILTAYFYFFTSFDLVALLDAILCVFVTLLAGINWIPLPLRLCLYYCLFRWYLFHRAGKKIEDKLIPEDEKMVGEDTGVFTLILGKMRGGKTTLATAFARILNTVYHKNAFDNMNRCSMMFPDFPWMALERDVARLSIKHRLVNMIQCAAFVDKIYGLGERDPRCLYGFDPKAHRTSYIDGATEISLRDALAIYAESYFVYFQPGNLIASNYPIRTDDLRLDKGHLVLYDSSYFSRKVRDMWKQSSLSRILVFDMLRLGKKKNEKNFYKDGSGPMIAVATEFGKEEGNMVSNQAYSAKDEGANPKNDLMDYSLKLGGHLANIWHTNFFKFIADEQRSGSLTSNLVNVAQSIYTADPKTQKEKMAVKLFWIEPIILEGLVRLRDDFYKKYRHNREDNTLLFTIINRLGSAAYTILTRIYMRYGYKEVSLPMCTADSTGNIIEGEAKKFYIINFVDYSSRFESACMKDFLNASKPKAYRGFFDIPKYKKLMPDKGEWDLQGSYLVSDLEDPESKFASKEPAKRKKASKRQAEPSGAGRRGGRS